MNTRLIQHYDRTLDTHGTLTFIVRKNQAPFAGDFRCRWSIYDGEREIRSGYFDRRPLNGRFSESGAVIGVVFKESAVIVDCTTGRITKI